MKRTNNRIIIILVILLACFGKTIFAQNAREKTPLNDCSQASGLNGVYRIDVDRSDRLYSVIEEATSNIPFADQQQFFMDLAVRLTPPDLLAIECRGTQISLASSRSPRIEFTADGVTRNARNSDGKTVRSRIKFERNSLTFNSGGSDDTLNFTFTPIEDGKRLRVTRRISSRDLIEPIVIKTVYNRIADIARWDVFDENQVARETVRRDEKNKISPAAVAPRAKLARDENDKASNLRNALNRWIDATNARNVKEQMSFYMPQLEAYYLARNASRDLVREEKNRVFAAAKSIDVRAAEPEIIFQDGGRAAVMRFRKEYNIVNGPKSRSGAVIQELRWRQTDGGWKIFSERDIKVLR